jgi:hypothetical protein
MTWKSQSEGHHDNPPLLISTNGGLQFTMYSACATLIVQYLPGRGNASLQLLSDILTGTGRSSSHHTNVVVQAISPSIFTVIMIE